MAKQIIILDTQPLPGNITQVNAVFWFPVVLARRVLLPGGTSAYKDASPGEIAEIQSGSIVEKQFQIQAPRGVSEATVKAQLVTAFTAEKASFDARPNPNLHYGKTFDGQTTAWSA
jgi:hypothetical protein